MGALTAAGLADEICAYLADEKGVTLPIRSVKEVLNALGTVAAEQIEDGNDFTVPGVVKIRWQYKEPLKKGERFKKGDEVTNPFTGESKVAEADSPAQKEMVYTLVGLQPKIKALVPGLKRDARMEFAKTKAGKAVKKRKG